MREALEKAPASESYEYTRMRWFFHQWDSDFRITEQSTLRRTAFRLLQQNPNDDNLKYVLAFDLAYTSNPVKEQDTAYRWAQQYQKKRPARKNADYLMGYVLECRFDRTQSLAVANAAIRHFQRFEANLQPNDQYLLEARKRIECVKEAIGIFRSHGHPKA